MQMAQEVQNPVLDILYVEDDAGHARLTMMCLDELPHIQHVRHVSDGEQALDYLFRRGEFADPRQAPRPRLILLDLRLPRVDGLEVLRQIRSEPRLRRLPVVVLTTSDADNDVTAAYELQVNSYLVKPFDFEEFNELVRWVGTYWMKANHLPKG